MHHKADNKKGVTLSERKQRIYDFLNINRVGVLASVDIYGEPHGSVIYHVIDRNLGVTFLTKSGTRKYDNLLRHPNTMLVVYDASTQSVAQIFGIASEVKDSYEVNKIAGQVMMSSIKTSEGIPPISKLEAGTYTAFRIKPLQVRMASYANMESGNYEQIFESIESFELEETKL